jgi:hypothetical protein
MRLLICLTCVLMCHWLVRAADTDPIATKFADAKATYKAKVIEAKQVVLDVFEARRAAADNAKKGPELAKAKEKINKLQTDYLATGKLPMEADFATAKQKQNELLLAARKTMTEAYDQAIDSYARANKLDETKVIDKQKAYFLKTFEVDEAANPLLANLNPVGKPKQFETGKAALIAIYFEEGFWYLACTADAKGGNKQFNVRNSYTGKVLLKGGTIQGQLDDLKTFDNGPKVLLKDRDFARLIPNNTGFEFQMVTFGGVDKIRFQVSPKTEELQFDIKIDGDDNPKHILIGQAGQHPAKSQFNLSTKLDN